VSSQSQVHDLIPLNQLCHQDTFDIYTCTWKTELPDAPSHLEYALFEISDKFSEKDLELAQH